LPPILFDGTNGVFPIEAVVATVEVKSTLDANELRTAHNSAKLVSSFAHAPPVGQQMHDAEHHIEHVIPYVLAFDTDLSPTGMSELDRYKKLHTSDEPAIRGLCVVGRGFWTFGGSRWHESQCSCSRGEVVGFVASLVNVCQRVARTRLQPDMLDYIEKTMPV
jgi:hypothetical protein